MKKKRLMCVIGVVLILLLCSCGGIDETGLTMEENYVGSVNSDIYHDPECQWANRIKEDNEIWFASAEEAEDEGYRACHICNP
ncbi:MAG: hypothetical protein J6A69_02445 [Clostridia bacterium]|nr:hypothetical protein [Clostridia bacterium]